MKAHLTKEEGDAIASMVVQVLGEVRRALKDEAAAPVDACASHTHYCRWCSSTWSDDRFSTIYPHALLP